MMFSTMFSLLPALVALPAANAYFILSHPVLETTRLDPIVNPGGIGAHVHSIVGGNNFDKDMTYESARQSTCTTASVSADKSNYWVPQLYYYEPVAQTYEAIPVSYVNTYYLPRYSPGEKTVRAFPDGLRMVSGDPNRRTYDNDADSNAVTYVCLDYSGQHSGDPEWAERNSFFNHNCPQGMRAQIFFRSCWDGVNLDSDDHMSHMAWPSGGVNGGSCPSTHPVRLVSLFYEFIYNVQNFPYNNGSVPTWVYSNGDTTGYGMHGDFLNGWPSVVNGTNVLQQALDGCNDNNGVGGVLTACPPFVPFLDSYSANACRPLNDQVDEDVGFNGPIKAIPGNNPIWIGDGQKPTYDNYTDDSIGYSDFKSIIPTGYTETGCIAEGTSGRALSAASFANDNMTRGACVSWCQDRGYPLAGIEYGRECYCDFAVRNGASNTTLLPQSQCSRACAANDNENCGGSSTLTLFNNPALYPVAKLPTGWSGNGCMTEGNGQRALNKYSFSTSSMTQELCMTTCQSKGYSLAGIEYSSECYCGNAFTSGSVPASDGCSMTCSGNKMQTCGGGNRLTTFKFSNATTVAAPSAAASSNTTSVSASASASSSSAAKSSASSSVASSSASASLSASSSKAVSSIPSSSSVAKVMSSQVVVSSSAAAKSSSVAVKPTSSAVNPASSSVKPASSSSKPVSSSAKPASSSSSSSSIKPTSSAAKSSSTSSTAPKSSTVPTPAAKFAAVNSSSSSSSIAKSTSSAIAKSSSSSAKPSSSTAKPSSSAVKTSSSAVKPSSSTAKPSSSAVKSSSSVAIPSSSSVAPKPVMKIASNQKVSSAAASSSASSVVASTSTSSAAASSSSSVAKSSASSAAASSSAAVSSSAAASSSSSVAKSSASSAAASSTSSVAASSTSSAAASSSASSSAAKSSTSSAAPSSSSSAAASSSAVPSSTSSSAAAPSASASAVAGYIGCFKDTSGGRHLTGGYQGSSKMNNAVCTAYCQSKGFAYAGTEYAQECYCGNTLNLALSTAESKCNTPCRVNSFTNGTIEQCGGGMILSVYSTGLDTGTEINSRPTRRSLSAKFRL